MTKQLFFKISTSNETVKNQIKDKIKNSLQALGEYVWNAIDAKANEIKIDIDYNGTTVRSIKIEDNGVGINYEEIQGLFVLSDSPKKNLHKDYLSLPHGKNGIGRFAFIKFAHQVNWKTIYESQKKKYSYEISIDGNALNDVEKIQEKELTNNNTGTIVKIDRFDIDQDLIKDSKNPLANITHFLIQEFYAIMQLYNIKIILNKKPINISKLIKKSFPTKLKIGNKEFNVNLINWNKDFCKDSKYYFLDSNKKEIYNIKSPLSKYDDIFLHSAYITSDLFDDFCPSSKTGSSEQQPLLDKDKFTIYHKLVDAINDFVNKSREPLTESLANRTVEGFDKKGYFDQILETKFDKEVRKPFVKDTTRAVIKFAPKILGGLSKDQTLVILNLINHLMDDDKYLLLDILKVLLKEENKESLEDLKNILDKYKLGEVTALIHEVDKRLAVVNELDCMHHNNKNKEYSEKDLQEVLNANFWVFGDNYNSLICSEETTFTKMRDIYVKDILKEDPKKYTEKVSRKQVDLFLHGLVGIDKLNKNLIVEIKSPSKPLSKQIYHDQLVGYAEIIRKRPEFKDPDKNEWHFLLVGHDFEDDFFTTHYQRKTEYLMEEIETANMRLYVMRWTDIISDLQLKYKFMKDRLNQKREEVIKKNK